MNQKFHPLVLILPLLLFLALQRISFNRRQNSLSAEMNDKKFPKSIETVPEQPQGTETVPEHPKDTERPESSSESEKSNGNTLSESEVRQLKEEWSTLRTMRGHFSGAQFNAAIDGPKGAKKQVMDKLYAHYTSLDSSSQSLVELLGAPDKLLAGKLAMMPGPVVGNGVGEADGEKGETFTMVYEWRGAHDYLFFKVDATSEQVVDSGWYHAYE